MLCYFHINEKLREIFLSKENPSKYHSHNILTIKRATEITKKNQDLYKMCVKLLKKSCEYKLCVEGCINGKKITFTNDNGVIFGKIFDDCLYYSDNENDDINDDNVTFLSKDQTGHFFLKNISDDVINGILFSDVIKHG
jgi:hypothetical protein